MLEGLRGEERIASLCREGIAANLYYRWSKGFFYFSDAGDLLNLRYNNYKIVFAEQWAKGYGVWEDPFVFLRWPKLFTLCSELESTRPLSYPPGRTDSSNRKLRLRQYLAA